MKLVPLLLLLLLLPLCTPFHAFPQAPFSPRGSYHHVLNQDSPLPMLSLVTDSHYSFGFQLGRTFQSRIKQFLADYPTLQKTLVPFVQTPQGRSAFDQFVSTAAAAYPDYLEELRGLSEGAQVPLSLVLLLNLRPELTGLINEQKKEVVTVQDEDASCTDVYLRTERLLLDAHNEDGSPYIRPSAYLVNVTLVEPAPSTSSSSYLAIGRKREERFVVKERWIAYAYPGVLPGNAFAFNGNGVTITMNALYPVNISRTGLGRAFVNRDVLRAKNLKDALRRAIPEDSATGFSINIGSIPEQRLMNVETSPQTFSLYEINGNYSHENMYKRVNITQHNDPSSRHRLKRLNEMPPPANMKDLLTALGDEEDKDYPIYRTATPPDTAVTVATGALDLKAKTMAVYIDNPKSSDPFLVFDMDI